MSHGTKEEPRIPPVGTKSLELSSISGNGGFSLAVRPDYSASLREKCAKSKDAGQASGWH
jgi:hypothetical protein